MNEERLSLLKDWLYEESQYTVVLTGAGMSTESGLPDFRSNDGLWHGKDPQAIASVQAMDHNREEFVDFYRWRMKELQKYAPHKGHELLTLLQRQGYVQRIITQNVDGFHQRAKSHDVIELHGSLQEVYCRDCKEHFEAHRYVEEGGEECPRCNGFLRPGIVLFGEMLDEQAIGQSVVEAQQADLFIVMGSSLQVTPASLLPLETKANGGKLVIMNKDETELDQEADLIIQGNIGEVLQRLV